MERTYWSLKPNWAALYGLLLMPMGAVIFADHYLLRPLGLHAFYAEKSRFRFHAAPAVAWGGALLLGWALNAWLGVGVFFLGLPGWFIAILLYVGASKLVQRPAAVLAAA